MTAVEKRRFGAPFTFRKNANVLENGRLILGKSLFKIAQNTNILEEQSVFYPNGIGAPGCPHSSNPSQQRNNRLSSKFRIHSGVLQGDSLALILFILTIEPILGLLESDGMECQSHCNDLAVVATQDKFMVVHQDLTTYERTSGAKLNADKSFLITRTPIAESPFPYSHTSRRYLGFDISHTGALLVPPLGVKRMHRGSAEDKKALPLSLTGRMAILTSYIIAFALRHVLIYLTSLWSNGGSFRLLSKTPTVPQKAPFSDKKLSHPAFFFCLQLLACTQHSP